MSGLAANIETLARSIRRVACAVLWAPDPPMRGLWCFWCGADSDRLREVVGVGPICDKCVMSLDTD